ncbi:hypothetical protein GGQ68_003570 [Sagittula marina]|uniref:Uncharacterized protein n=1 Tax=Sagittula marina TaxID=943940 RepID=A0A7W6DXU3_9RHOB|nr:hypothetical protein [Sagittula marina]
MRGCRSTAQQLTDHTFAQDAARRNLAADRAEEALRTMEACIASEDRKDRFIDAPEVDSAHFACLENWAKRTTCAAPCGTSTQSCRPKHHRNAEITAFIAYVHRKRSIDCGVQ